MQSILTNATSKVSPNIVHLQVSNYTSQPLVAVGDILLPPVHLCLFLLIISCQPPNSHPSHSHILSTCAIAKEKKKKTSTILWLLQVKCRLRSMATCLTRLHLPSVFFILWQLVATIVTSKTAWLRLCPHTRAESSWLAESQRKNSYMRRWAQKRIHMDAQAHVTQSDVWSQTYGSIHVHTHTRPHTHYSAVLWGQTLVGVGGLD